MNAPPPSAPRGALETLGAAVAAHPMRLLAALALCTGLALSQLPKLGFDFSPQALFDTNEELADQANAFKETFGHTENLLLVMVEAEDVLQAAVLEDVYRVSEALRGVGGVTRVESLSHSALPRGALGAVQLEALMSGPGAGAETVLAAERLFERSALVRGRLISADRTLAVVVAHLDEAVLPAAVLLETLAEVESLLFGLSWNEGSRWRTGGVPAVRAEAVRRLQTEQLTFIPLSLAVFGIALLVLFRNRHGAWLPLACVAIAVSWIMGLMAALGEPLNIINNVLPTLLFTIGLSDSVHVMSRYREERALGAPRGQAAAKTFRAMAVACFLTSWTTSIGFLSLMSSNTDILRRFGLVCSVGVLFAYIVTITLLPAALAHFGLDVQEGDADARRKHREAAAHHGLLERVVLAITRLGLTHPKRVLAGTFVLGLGLLPGLQAVRVDSAMLEIFPERDPVSQVTRTLESKLQGVLPVEVELRSAQEGRMEDPAVLNAVERVMERMAEEPMVLATTSVTTWLREVWFVFTGREEVLREPFRTRAQAAQLLALLDDRTHDPLGPWLTFDRSRLRIQLSVADVGGQATLRLVERLHGVLSEELATQEDVTWIVSGDGYTGAAGLLSLIDDFLSSISWAFALILISMWITFRSFRLAIISMPVNAIPLTVTLATMGWLGIDLNTTTVILFTISLGLAVDDAIHYLARYSEAISRGLDVPEAIEEAALGAGRAIVWTTLLLAAGLLVLGLSAFVPTQRFALLTAMTLVGCLIADIVLLPALLRLFGRANPLRV